MWEGTLYLCASLQTSAIASFSAAYFGSELFLAPQIKNEK